MLYVSCTAYAPLQSEYISVEAEALIVCHSLRAGKKSKQEANVGEHEVRAQTI